jgi:hypothetical protein
MHDRSYLFSKVKLARLVTAVVSARKGCTNLWYKPFRVQKIWVTSAIFKKYLQCLLVAKILIVDFVVCTLAVKKKSGQVSTCRIGPFPCQADNNSRKLRLRCRCQFPWCALALRVLAKISRKLLHYTLHTPNTQLYLPKWRQSFIILRGQIPESRMSSLNSSHERELWNNVILLSL